ncbi:BET1 homolog [Dendroctonus ponderosae]|uniref:BET1 homolog n=1 Tax=Dendroctonus ponderosae TaxID=77166 RepID=U4U0L8_DENPD|nr:BET1 homolog [Dendroctonus ponderosae]ERL86632.1 hypothetical protein D910_04039 [Dendroctonus ponderosae]KAH1003299.1 hypothetical protein HUJ05_011226 [Dendroctonus ponderosae]
MRRSHHYEPLPQDANSAIEQENERMTHELAEKIGVLKSLSIDIGTEVQHQHKLLRDVDDDMDRTGGFLGKTMSRVAKLSRGSHNYIVLYLFVFALLVFFILYLALKLR